MNITMQTRRVIFALGIVATARFQKRGSDLQSSVLLNLGVPTAGYTDNLTSPAAIKALHISELQQRANY